MIERARPNVTEASQSPAAIPGRIGPYRITGELGRGGIGTVYRALDPSGRAVALKCLLRGGDPDTDARLLRESSFRVEHPHVVRTLGGGMSAAGQPYLVLELLEGRTLREALVSAGARDVVSWIAQAADGIAALHEAGLVHRDVKPENLFLTRDGTVKVLDLGIAAWSDDRARLTATGAVIGTPSYLAPEQVRGGRALDPRVDVWALGVVLFEGLTGRSPFRREGALATMLAVSVDPIPCVDDLAPHVPPRLARLVRACMERAPEHRLASASLLASGLREVIADGSLDAASASAPPREVERAIALLVAPGALETRAGIEGIVSGAGGSCLWLADGRVAGVFGASESIGDEAERVLRAASGVEKLTGRVSIALGRASVTHAYARGAAVREAEEALARAPSGVVCGARTAQVLRGIHALEEIEPGLYRLGGEDRLPPTSSPLLARDVELGLLRRARDAALAESSPRVSYVIGPPGAGKTRLAEAVRGLAAELVPPMSVREAHATSAGAPTTGRLFARASGETGAPRHGAEDATLRVDRAREALVSELSRTASEGPLALVFEDAHWADPQTLALLEDLPLHLEGLPVWLVVTGRPELLERLREGPGSGALVEPGPLSARDAIALARALGQPAPSLETAQALVAHTGGNPLFVEVVLAAYGGTLDAATLRSAALPATIEFAVQARLDRLPRSARDVLVALAVLDRAAEVSELVELGCADAESALELLASRDLVVRGPSARHAGRTYRVRSPVVTQVASALPSGAERVELHRRAASLAARRGRDEEELGHHLEAAGDAGAAASAYLAAALAAMNGGDARKVLRCGHAALRCGLAIEDALELHLARADAARWAGDVEEQSLALEHAERAAVSEGERARVESALGDLERRRGEPAAALARLDRAIALARSAGDRDTLAWASCRRAIASVSLGRLDEADASLAGLRAIDGLEASTRGAIEDAHGYVAGTRGDLAERRRAFAAAAELHASAGDLRRAAGAESNAADAAHLLGLDALAEAGLRRAIALARRVGNRLSEGYALTNLGRTLGSLGRLDEARDVLEQAQALASRLGDGHLRSAAALYACRLDPSGEGARGAVAALLGDDSPAVRAGAHLIAASHASSRAEACAHAEAAVALADAGLEEGEVETWRDAARTLEAHGEHARAAELRARARARLEALAARITDPEMRASFLARAHEHRA